MAITRIYGLVDPRDGKVRYVGRTSQPLHKRLCGHIHQPRRHTRRDHWVVLLSSLGLKPLITCLAVVEGNGFEAERWWIAKLKKVGLDIINHHPGGGGCIPGIKPAKRLPPSPEVRARISASLKGRKIGFALFPENMHHRVGTPEAEAKRRASLRQPASEERKKRARESNLRTWSDPKLRQRSRERALKQTEDPRWAEKYREVQKNAWAKLTPDERDRRKENISKGIAKRKQVWL